MKVFCSIQLLFVFYLLPKNLAQEDPMKFKKSTALRGRSNEYSQILASKGITRELGRRNDRRGRPVKLDSTEGLLRANGRENLKNEMDIVLRSEPNLGIINGMISEENRYGYMVSLTDQHGNHICGGSLIKNNLVLTAAHCKGYLSKAQIGRYNTADFSEKYEIFDVIGEVEHPDYDNYYLWYDFMIVVLGGKSTFPTVTLPDKNQNISADLTVFGWGATDPNGLPYRGPLLEVNLKYISNSQCMSSSGFVDGVYGSYQGLIKDNNMCADADNSDVCFGDSGGPLIIKGSTSSDDIQVGIVSWGFGCNHPEFPAVYARIDNQMDWIKKVVCILAGNHVSSNFDCTRKQERSSVSNGTSCKPERGCVEGFTCINEICVRNKDRNDRSP